MSTTTQMTMIQIVSWLIEVVTIIKTFRAETVSVLILPTVSSCQWAVDDWLPACKQGRSWLLIFLQQITLWTANLFNKGREPCVTVDMESGGLLSAFYVEGWSCHQHHPQEHLWKLLRAKAISDVSLLGYYACSKIWRVS